MCKEETNIKEMVDDPVHHPKHYNNHPAGVECIDVVEHFNPNLANAIKYCWRCGDKGKPIQDLEKAKWYINRELKRIHEFHLLENYSQYVD